MEMISRMDAARKGLPRYFTGVACGKGHTTPRYTSSGNCCECAKRASNVYARNLKAARYGIGMVEFKAMIHKDDLAGVEAHVAAVDAARRLITPGLPCNTPCTRTSCPGEFKGLCTGVKVCDNLLSPGAAPAAPRTCTHGVPPNEVCTTCDIGEG